MKRFNTHIITLVAVTVLSILVVPGSVSALDWTYVFDVANDASGGQSYEIYRMGYAFADDFLYFNHLTGVPEEGVAYEQGSRVNAGDLYINVGGSHLDGYEGSGYDAEYASGNVFGLALTSHSGDMNADFTPTRSAYRGGNADNDYDWSAVTQGHLYSDAFFSTGVYDAYEGTSYWKQSQDDDGGNDPFNYANNAPVHIAEYGADLGFQGNVTWSDLKYTAVNASGSVKKNAYEVNAMISLDSLSIVGSESFELWWSMECGNDFAMISGTMPNRPVATPEPGTLLLLGVGLVGITTIIKKKTA